MTRLIETVLVLQIAMLVVLGWVAWRQVQHEGRLATYQALQVQQMAVAGVASGASTQMEACVFLGPDGLETRDVVRVRRIGGSH